jgi:hypothetical protein
MDSIGPNQAQLVGRHVHPPQSDSTFTRCRSSQKTNNKKKYSSPSTWLATQRDLEAHAASPCAADLSSSRLPNVVHASTPPAARS